MPSGQNKQNKPVMLQLMPVVTLLENDRECTRRHLDANYVLFLFSFFFFFVSLPFLGPLPRHMEVPRLGV